MKDDPSIQRRLLDGTYPVDQFAALVQLAAQLWPTASVRVRRNMIIFVEPVAGSTRLHYLDDAQPYPLGEPASEATLP